MKTEGGKGRRERSRPPNFAVDLKRDLQLLLPEDTEGRNGRSGYKEKKKNPFAAPPGKEKARQRRRAGRKKGAIEKKRKKSCSHGIWEKERGEMWRLPAREVFRPLLDVAGKKGETSKTRTPAARERKKRGRGKNAAPLRKRIAHYLGGKRKKIQRLRKRASQRNDLQGEKGKIPCFWIEI